MIFRDVIGVKLFSPQSQHCCLLCGVADSPNAAYVRRLQCVYRIDYIAGNDDHPASAPYCTTDRPSQSRLREQATQACTYFGGPHNNRSDFAVHWKHSSDAVDSRSAPVNSVNSPWRDPVGCIGYWFMHWAETDSRGIDIIDFWVRCRSYLVPLR